MAMAARVSRVSEGHLPMYGKKVLTDGEKMAFWRERCNNEQTGCPDRDPYGSNAGMSMLWNPEAPTMPDSAYAFASRKRPSELKAVQDLGAFERTSSSVAPRLPPSAMADSMQRRAAPPELAPPRPPTFLDGEAERLQASNHARALGQTFLRAGNLTQAKIYLKRAERLLRVGGAANASESG